MRGAQLGVVVLTCLILLILYQLSYRRVWLYDSRREYRNWRAVGETAQNKTMMNDTAANAAPPNTSERRGSDCVRQTMSDSARPLVFLHIPRTGGGTLGYLLQELFRGSLHPMFNDSNELNASDWELFKNMEWQKSWKAFAVHEDWSLLYYVPIEVNTLALLREPAIQRSSVFYTLMTNEPEIRGMSFRDWLLSDSYTNFEMAQVDFLAGVSRIYPHSRNLAAWGLRMEPKERLAVAKRNLCQTAWFGITERWEESMQLFQCAFGMQVPEIPSEHVQKAGARVGPNERRIIETRGIIEYELWEYAVELFEARLVTCRGGIM